MKPTLGLVFALSLLGLAAVLALLFYLVFDASQASIEASSERLREDASREIAGSVSNFLNKAPDAVEQFQFAVDHGLADPKKPNSIELTLFAGLLSNSDIGEVTFTYGEKTGTFEGNAVLAEQPRGQWSVVRSAVPSEKDKVWSRRVYQEGGMFVAERRKLDRTSNFTTLPWVREERAATDPTIHPTFTTPAKEIFDGVLVWSDLHWSQFGDHKTDAEVSVQQVVNDAAGKFAGVLRVGLLTRRLDRAVRISTPDGTLDPHRVFLCDGEGRLLTRIAQRDRLREFGEDLRIAPDSLPPEVQGALADPTLHSVGEEIPVRSGNFQSNGKEFLTTFRFLTDSQGWIIGIVVPRSHYLGRLAAMRFRMLLISLAIMFVLVAGGALILRAVKRAHGQITHESIKMNAFDFSPAPTATPFRDVSDVLDGLENAKTAMRALGKYVPVDLVRRLYRERNEPVLGGDAIDISIMFTDIKDFTRMSEELDPGVLARALGRYLEVMARIIQQDTRGTIDKYIGDAIMTIWNAPEPVADHARMACLAALRCRDAARDLARSPDWIDLPPFETRFGLHCDTATVGHFGAPDRMNYTAIGDSVNLASRLEGLNKFYATSIIVSENIVRKAGDSFSFRRLDRVAVKGKNRAITIYELLGIAEDTDDWRERVSTYERALDAYAAGNFADAIQIMEAQPGDPPGLLLTERCRSFLAKPPPIGWNGVSTATSK